MKGARMLVGNFHPRRSFHMGVPRGSSAPAGKHAPWGFIFPRSLSLCQALRWYSEDVLKRTKRT